MNQIIKRSLFMACAVLAVVKPTLSSENIDSIKTDYVPLKHFHEPLFIDDARSYITEVMNDTDYDVILNYPFGNYYLNVKACMYLNGEDAFEESCLVEGQSVLLPARSRSLLRGAMIPVEEPSEEKEILEILFLAKVGDYLIPQYRFIQNKGRIFCDLKISEKIKNFYSFPVIGVHSFSLLLTQVHDDVLYKSLKTGQLHINSSSLKVDLAVNERTCS